MVGRLNNPLNSILGLSPAADAQAGLDYYLNAQNTQAQQAIGQYPTTQPVFVPTPMHARAREMFLKRVGGLRAEMQLKPEDFLHCHVFNEEVVVFYLFGGKEGIVREPLDLFPSDTLVAQFRLIVYS